MYSAVKEAGSLGVPLTVHAGERPEKFNPIENVEFAVNTLKVRRIGHAIVLRSDEQLLDQIRENGNITIEVRLIYVSFVVRKR
jgi:adenosine deaminase